MTDHEKGFYKTDQDKGTNSAPGGHKMKISRRRKSSKTGFKRTGGRMSGDSQSRDSHDAEERSARQEVHDIEQEEQDDQS